MTAKRLLITALLTTAAWAQTTTTPPPFTMRIQLGTNVQIVSDGATLAMPADGVGLAVAASISVNYTGTTQATLTGFVLTGSTDFSVPNSPSGQPVLTPFSPSTGFTVQYQPSNSRAQSAKITFNYIEGPAQTKGSFSLNLTGTAPEFAYTYTPQPNGNSTLLSSGDTIIFPALAVFDTETDLITITNKGSGEGVVNGITYKGAADFTLAGLPFPPALIDPGKSLQFQVIFTPSDLPGVSGTVRVDFVAGRNLTFAVAGTGLGALFDYGVVRGKTTVPVAPGDLIALPDANVNDTSRISVRVHNSGNTDGEIAAISVSGTGFTLADLPFLPDDVAVNGAFNFTVIFSPTQPGKQTGKLKVGSDSFDLTATGLGPVLTYGYASGSSNFTLQGGGSVVFTPVAVGQTNTVRFTINNTGTADTAVNSISASGPAAGTFALGGLPTLPVTIAPGTSAAFNLTFAPNVLGTATGTLRIDGQTFTLTGIGNAPAALPGYSYSGTSGTIDARTQPAVGLTLSAPYPLDLTGTLTLAFNSAVFANDPAVQFQVGGRTVNFTIPANTTKALFANQANTIQIQSGTVAGTIVLTPTFATAAGGIDLTPTNPPSMTLTIPQQAPVLLSVAVSARTANTITLLVTGYATSRSVTQMDFQFTPVATETVSTTKVTLPVDPSFTAWYQSSASVAFGSNFTATVPFTLTGDVNKVTNVSDTVQSVSVTLTNAQGVSAAKSVAFQ